MTSKHLIALAAGVCFACAMSLAHASKTAGQAIDDSTLAAETKAALVEAKEVPSPDINVEVYKGAVQLGGFVSNQGQKDAALKAAKTVEGHVRVIDALVIVPGGRSMGMTLDDSTIQTKLKAELVQQMSVEAAGAINTDVRRGQVLLSGWVSDAGHKEHAGSIAKTIQGVTNVHNELAIKP